MLGWRFFTFLFSRFIMFRYEFVGCDYFEYSFIVCYRLGEDRVLFICIFLLEIFVVEILMGLLCIWIFFCNFAG